MLAVHHVAEICDFENYQTELAHHILDEVF